MAPFVIKIHLVPTGGIQKLSVGWIRLDNTANTCYYPVALLNRALLIKCE